MRWISLNCAEARWYFEHRSGMYTLVHEQRRTENQRDTANRVEIQITYVQS